jgi:hypothetical protein
VGSISRLILKMIPVVKGADNCLSDNRRQWGGVSRYQPVARRKKGSMGVGRSVNGFDRPCPDELASLYFRCLAKNSVLRSQASLAH